MSSDPYALTGALSRSLRIIARQKAFSAAVIVSLAIGISIPAGMLAVLESAHRGRLPFANAERLEHLFVKSESCGAEKRCWPLSRDVIRAVASQTIVEAVGVYRPATVTIQDRDHHLSVWGTDTDVQFPSIVGVSMSSGRAFGAPDLRGPPLVMLSYGFWQARFNSDASVVGRDLVIRGVAHRVVGIMAQSVDFGGNFWTSDLTHGGGTDVAGAGLSAIVLVRRDVDLARARVAIRGTGTAALLGERAGRSAEYVSSMPFRDFLIRRLAGVFVILTLVASVIGLIGAVNFAGLLLSRGIRRRGEMGMRAALGASVSRLAVGIVGECLVLCAIGGLGGALVAPAVLGVLRFGLSSLLPAWVEISVGPWTLLGAVGLAMAIGILFAVSPALDIARPALTNFVRGGSSTSSGRANRARASLVAVQVALATGVLVFVTSIVGRWMVFATPSSGYSSDHLLSGSVWPDSAGGGAAVLDARALLGVIRQLPGVVDVAGSRSYEYHQRALGAIGWITTAGRFANVAGLELVRGRFPTADEERSGAPVSVVSTSLADRVSDGLSVGSKLEIPGMPGRQVTVIGVIKELSLLAGSDAPSPVVITPVANDQFSSDRKDITLWVRVVGNPAAAQRPLMQAIIGSGVVSARSLDLAPVSERFEARRRESVLLAQSGVAIFGIALALAALGLYGLVSYTTEVRARELAIREALGQTRTRVAALVLRDASLQAALGIGVGVLLGWVAAVMLGQALLGATLVPVLGSAVVASIAIGATVVVSSIGPLKGIWKRDLSAVLRA